MIWRGEEEERKESQNRDQVCNDVEHNLYMEGLRGGIG